MTHCYGRRLTERLTLGAWNFPQPWFLVDLRLHFLHEGVRASINLPAQLGPHAGQPRPLMDESDVLGDGAAAPLAKLRQYSLGLQPWR